MVPSKEQYEANIYEGIRLQMATFVNECHEEMMVNTHKRNREMGEGKLKFEVSRQVASKNIYLPPPSLDSFRRHLRTHYFTSP